MIKKLIIIFYLLVFGCSVSAEMIAYKLNNNLKIKGAESIKVHATPLIDNKIILKSKNQIKQIIAFASNQSDQVTKKNKNRKPRTKFKGWS
jgi:hypothetical protein